MHSNTKPMLYWTPRVLGVVYALFLSLFALTVFNEGRSTGDMLVALCMSLIPALIVAAALVVAWKWERLGAFLYFALAIGYFFWSKRIDWSVVIAGPMIVIGLLFLFDWKSGQPSQSRSLQPNVPH